METYTKQEWDAIINPIIQNTSDFETACSYFRQICQEIRIFIGNENFKGYFDELPDFYNNTKYKEKKGMQLAIALNGCTKLCEYEAKKLGIINWLDRCWEIVNSSSSSQNSSSSQSSQSSQSSSDSRGQSVGVSWLQENWSKIPGFIYKGNDGRQYFYEKTYVYGTIYEANHPGEIRDTLYINGVKIQGQPRQASDQIAEFLKDRDPYIDDWWFEQVYVGGWKYGGLIFYQAKDGGMVDDDGTMQTRTYLIGAADCDLYSNSTSIQGTYNHSCMEGGDPVTVTISTTQEEPNCVYALNQYFPIGDAATVIGFSRIGGESESLKQQYQISHLTSMITQDHTFGGGTSDMKATKHEHIIKSCYGLYEVDGEWTLFLPDSSYPLEVTGGTEYSDDGVKKTSSNPLSAMYGKFKSSVYEKSGEYYLYLDQSTQ